MSLHDSAVAVLSSWQPDEGPYADHTRPGDQARLRDAYLAYLGRHRKATSRDCQPGHLTASGIVLDPTAAATLLVLHGKLGLWVQPGGHCEPDDHTLASVAEREVVEETGLSDPIVDPDPVLLSTHPAPCEADWHYDVQHLVMADRDHKITLSDESRDVRWFEVDALPDDLAAGVAGLIAAGRRRINPAART